MPVRTILFTNQWSTIFGKNPLVDKPVGNRVADVVASFQDGGDLGHGKFSRVFRGKFGALGRSLLPKESRSGRLFSRSIALTAGFFARNCLGLSIGVNNGRRPASGNLKLPSGQAIVHSLKMRKEGLALVARVGADEVKKLADLLG